jgi:hypothetical protein
MPPGGGVYENGSYVKTKKVNIERLPEMAGAAERMIFEQETIGQVLRPGQGMPEELDFMKKIHDMKEVKRKLE